MAHDPSSPQLFETAASDLRDGSTGNAELLGYFLVCQSLVDAQRDHEPFPFREAVDRVGEHVFSHGFVERDLPSDRRGFDIRLSLMRQVLRQLRREEVHATSEFLHRRARLLVDRKQLLLDVSSRCCEWCCPFSPSGRQLRRHFALP